MYQVALAAEQQEDEDSDVHEPGLGLVHPGVVEVVEDGDHDLQHLAQG